MVRIGNKEIPINKNVRAGLTRIYGIGWFTAETIINKLGIEIKKRIRDLSEAEIKSISGEIKHFTTEGELREKVQRNINEQIRLGTYQGLRRSRKPNPLPIHGQRTRHNARTAKAGAMKLKPGEKRKKGTVAGKKKAPTPK
jgi:ribosomal protein uS13